MKGYVVHNGKRYRVLSSRVIDESAPPLDILRLRPFKGSDIQAEARACTPWKRGSVRHMNGKIPHRDKRPVNLSIDTATEIVTARLKGKRKGFTCTFGGLYDMLARQEAINAKRDRAFAKRTGRK